MALDDILKGFQAFNQGLQQYATGEALQQANQKLGEINQQQQQGLLKQEEAIQQSSLLSSQLANTLGSMGADASTIANTAGRFGVSQAAQFQANQNEKLQQKAFENQLQMSDKRLEQQKEMATFQDILRRRGEQPGFDMTAVGPNVNPLSIPADVRPFYATNLGFVSRKEDAKEISSIGGQLKSQIGKIDQLEELAGKLSLGEKVATSDARRVAKQLNTMLVAGVRKEVVGPGAVSEAEWKLLKDVVADPTQLSDFTAQAALKKFRSELVKNYKNKFEAAGGQLSNWSESQFGDFERRSMLGAGLRSELLKASEKLPDPNQKQVLKAIVDGKVAIEDTEDYRMIMKMGIPADLILKDAEGRGIEVESTFPGLIDQAKAAQAQREKQRQIKQQEAKRSRWDKRRESIPNKKGFWESIGF